MCTKQDNYIPQYSEEAFLSRAKIIDDDIRLKIYVEDYGKEYLYETIINSITDNYIKNKFLVIGLGSKNSVKKEFKDNFNKNAIYIVDGDFDRFLDKDDLIDDESFIYLRTYNIESNYIDDENIIKFIKGKIKKTDLEVKNIVNLEEWHKSLKIKLFELFIYFCYIQKYSSGVKNIGKGFNFYFNDDLEFNEEYYKMLEKLKYNDFNFLSKFEDLRNKVLDDIMKEEDFICGKYLLMSLSKYLRIKIGKKITFKSDDLEWALISNIRKDKLYYIEEVLNNRLKFKKG